MSRRERFLVGVLVVLVVMVGGYWLINGINQQVHQRLASAVREEQRLSGEVARLEGLAGTRESLQERVDEVTEELNRLQARLPLQLEQARIVQGLYQKAVAEGLSITSVGFSDDPIVALDVRTEGSLSGHLRWLNALMSDEQLMLIESVTWTRLGSGRYDPEVTSFTTSPTPPSKSPTAPSRATSVGFPEPLLAAAGVTTTTASMAAASQTPRAFLQRFRRSIDYVTSFPYR